MAFSARVSVSEAAFFLPLLAATFVGGCIAFSAASEQLSSLLGDPHRYGNCLYDRSIESLSYSAVAGVSGGCVMILILIFLGAGNRRKPASRRYWDYAAVVFACLAFYTVMLAATETFVVCVTPLGGLGGSRRVQMPVQLVFWMCTNEALVTSMGRITRMPATVVWRNRVVLFFMLLSYAVVTYTELFGLWVAALCSGLTFHVLMTVHLVGLFKAAFVLTHSEDHFARRLILWACPLTVVLWATFPLLWILGQFNLVTTGTERATWPFLELFSKASIAAVLVVGDLRFQAQEVDLQLSLLDSQRLYAQRAFEAKRAFLRWILHEMRVPLQGGVLALEELQFGLSDTALKAGMEAAAASGTAPPAFALPLRGASDSAAASVTAVGKLLDDFLDLAKIEDARLQLEPASVNLQLWLAEVTSAFSDALRVKSMQLRLSPSRNVPAEITVDGSRLRQVLSNYLSNAVKFSPVGSEVIVRLRVLWRRPTLLLPSGNGEEDTIDAVDITEVRAAPASLSHRRLGSGGVDPPSPAHRAVEVAAAAAALASERVGRMYGYNEVLQGASPFAFAFVCATCGHQRRWRHFLDAIFFRWLRCLCGIACFRVAPQPQPAVDSDSERDGGGGSTNASSPPGSPVPLLTTDSSHSRRASTQAGSWPPPASDTDSRGVPALGTVPMLHVAVDDCGVGVTADEVPLLFYPYHQIRAGAQLKGNNTGLGLALCKKIVELSGGSVGVMSEPGRGSRFWFEVPVNPPAGSTRPLAAASAAAAVAAQPIPKLQLAGPLFIRSPRHPEITSDPQTTSDSYGPTPRYAVGTPGAVAVRVHTGRSSDVDFVTSCGDDQSPSSPAVQRIIPVHTSAAAAAAEAAGGLAPPLRAIVRVVVVDDVSTNRDMLARLLARNGCTVVFTAEHGADCLAKLAVLCAATAAEASRGADSRGSSSAIDALVDAWFLDNNMPVMDGVELIRRLRGQGVRAPIVGVTGNALEEDQAGMRAAGASAVQTKPCSTPRLVETLARIGLRLPAQQTVVTPRWTLDNVLPG